MFKKDVLVVLQGPDADRAIRGILVKGRWFGKHYKLANAQVIEGPEQKPVKADGEIWIRKSHVAWVQAV